MKKVFKVLGYFVLFIVIVLILLFVSYYFSRSGPVQDALAKLGPPADKLLVDGQPFRDLNKNGELDLYEDYRTETTNRVEDLLSKMTLEEKAGMLFHNFLTIGPDGELAGALNPMNVLPVEVALFEKKMNFFNLFDVPDVKSLARWHNEIQGLAERTRLGIPITISSDPRHTAMDQGAVIGFYTDGFSHWPEPIGFGAINDSSLVYQFGKFAAQEYRAVGIHTALHPMLDVATDPRWARISGTFGEDAEVVKRLGSAYIRGFQGDSLSPSSVSTMAKHFPGGGPQKEGWDPHFRSGKDQVYPGGRFSYHLEPFKAAIEAGTSQIMPYYGVPIGLEEYQEVAFGFNEGIIDGLLRDSLNYEGIVCSDWGLINDVDLFGFEIMEAKDFGVEDLEPRYKMLESLKAGVDQFGGEAFPEGILQLVEEGELSESRLDQSVRKLLKLKFDLGLFDNPYVDVERIDTKVSTEEADSLGYQAQLRSQVLLTNKDINGSPVLPLANGTKIFIQNLNPDVASTFGEVVETVEEADVAILNIGTPYEPGLGKIAGMEFLRQGRLHYTEEELQPIMEIIRQKPTVITLYLERPAVIPELAESASAILANFGTSHKAIFDILFGNFNPEGTLPFEMPSSREAVRQQHEDVPFDSPDPLFPYRHGRSYP